MVERCALRLAGSGAGRECALGVFCLGYGGYAGYAGNAGDGIFWFKVFRSKTSRCEVFGPEICFGWKIQRAFLEGA